MVNTFEDIINVISSQVQSIPNIKDSTNFWMVRSKKGVFYREFLNKSYIAIGWNALTKNELDEHNDNYLKNYLVNSGYTDKMPRTAVNKCRRFIDEVKDGDIAMIVGRDEIAFAYIGKYFESNDPSSTVDNELYVTAQIDKGSYAKDDCPYKKRRHITLITKMSINIVSPAIYKCLVSNRHSLSKLNDYADSIISASYDVAYYKNRMIVKYHVGQPKDINPIDLSLFTLNTAKLLADDERKISGKYNINSEGDIVFFLINNGKDVYEFIRDNIVAIWISYSILFGGKGLGFEIPSAVDKLKTWVTDILCLKHTIRLKKAEADKVEAENEKIKAETEQIKIDNELK